ncbi:MAG TPA: diadenylate cyclase [Acidimicrobiales bacterium]|nr:diadenylate cyclase [Acidimicrobiales bacterium]
MTAGERRLARLAEELEESGLPPIIPGAPGRVLLEEIDHALRPEVHERHVPSSGTIIDPRTAPGAWPSGTQLEITHLGVAEAPPRHIRRFVDGLSSWLVRRTEPPGDEWLVFDRPAGSERDLVVLADALDATVVQRHPVGVVRVVGRFGVLRWEGVRWWHAPPVSTRLAALDAEEDSRAIGVLEALLRLAVHDLGSLGIGALLVYRPGEARSALVRERLPIPPALEVARATHLGPLRHALSQVDGAALFDGAGVLRHLGVELVPHPDPDLPVVPWGGTRHSAALRYSRDDPSAVVIVVSEDGPVTVVRDGAVVAPVLAVGTPDPAHGAPR